MIPQNKKYLCADELHLIHCDTNIASRERRWITTYHFKICLNNTETEVGKCDLRVGNVELLYVYGNIGYTVFEQFRGNKYAAKACKILFEIAKQYGMKFLYITCNPDNIASRKTCESIGGVLLDIVALPPKSELYKRGDKHKCIYRFDL